MPALGPVFDAKRRGRAAQVVLGAAAVLTLVALARPLAPDRPAWLQATAALALATATAVSVILWSLRGRTLVETAALYALLVLSVDAVGQVMGPAGWPLWPLMVLLV